MATAKPAGTNDLRGMGQADLQAELEKLRRELWDQRVKAKEGALQQTHLLGHARKQIARIRTILREQTAKQAR
jgi:ribosomal protein L29